MENQNINKQEVKKERTKLSVENIVGIVLIAVFLPVIILNMVFIVKGVMDPEGKTIPKVFGVAPLIVISNSMTISEKANNGGAFNEGDLIFVRDFEEEELEVGTIVSFVIKNSKGKYETTSHRITGIIDIEEEHYNPAVEEYNLAKEDYDAKKAKYEKAVEDEVDQTQLDAFKADLDVAEDNMNDAKDKMDMYAELLETDKYIYETQGDYDSSAVVKVYIDEIQGVYLFRIPFVGSVIEFFRTIPGILVLIVIPVGAYFIFELIRKSNSSKKTDEKIAELEARLAQQAQAQANAQVIEQPKEDVIEDTEQEETKADN